ncbi:MAG: FHA domain-containing protein [Ramlibacter sp.]|nr:FHA domain-containing protein [Ramlibacter sp.]MBX3658165.1 FHA domain-containing protein [Ramlibacter sp.]MCW5648540.1 FHA domain-containing protein [Ramlibacter sp.]
MPQLIASVEGVEIKHVYLTKDRTTLGRRPGNDIVLDNLAVSGDHCAFELHGLADVSVEDLHSTNGTFVNNRKVVGPHKLVDGDVIAIGKFRIQYLAASEQPSNFSATSAMKLDPAAGAGDGVKHASLRVLSGSSAGIEVPVVKAVTTFGKPGVSVVAISHRRNGYYVAHMDGDARPLLNDVPIGADPLLLSNHDVLELAGTKLLFLWKE